ncbi:MAG: hypothetical protein ACXVUL_21580 [Solirubrobacteraceae bacterium]
MLAAEEVVLVEPPAEPVPLAPPPEVAGVDDGGEVVDGVVLAGEVAVDVVVVGGG